jgi:hypothetical protein
MYVCLFNTRFKAVNNAKPSAKSSLFIRVIAGERCLPLIEILCITFFEIGVLRPFGCVKDQLTDRHAGINFYRA